MTLDFHDTLDIGGGGDKTAENFLPANTTISVKTDGTGDYTSLISALTYTENKWSDGQIIIELGSGTFNEGNNTIVYNPACYQNILIKGAGYQNTTVSSTSSGILVETSGITTNFMVRDIAFSNSSTGWAFRITDNSHCIFRGTVAFSGGSGITAYRNGEILIFDTMNFTDVTEAISSTCGTITSGWGPAINFSNVNKAYTVECGGIIRLYSPANTFTNVTTKVSQSVGTATTKGWICGFTV